MKKGLISTVAAIALTTGFTMSTATVSNAATNNYCVKYGYGEVQGGVRCYGDYNKYHYYSAIVTCNPNLWWLGFKPFTLEGPRVRNGAYSFVFCGSTYYVKTIQVRH